jgi:hypothetical protein
MNGTFISNSGDECHFHTHGAIPHSRQSIRKPAHTQPLAGGYAAGTLVGAQ